MRHKAFEEVGGPRVKRDGGGVVGSFESGGRLLDFRLTQGFYAPIVYSNGLPLLSNPEMDETFDWLTQGGFTD